MDKSACGKACGQARGQAPAAARQGIMALRRAFLSWTRPLAAAACRAGKVLIGDLEFVLDASAFGTGGIEVAHHDGGAIRFRGKHAEGV